MNNRNNKVAHAAVARRPLSPRQYAKINRSKSTALLIWRGRTKAFVSRAVASESFRPAKLRDNPAPIRVQKAIRFVIPCWNHN